jgi:two-component sensor histidine kinase
MRAVVISVHDRGTQPSGTTLGVMEIDDTADPPPVGLTIVRLLAEQQGGKAWAESDPHGARFHVRLPVRRAA